ncbi:hypothetical protein [Geobacter argillaceus]|uniref:Uncharacterized protein n=1 Tax=Geobacter argillaceus TaxID=345631 RepID=A0A562VN81_9BACT|nr:hypothetical protein [Geobacter argillaceus]TWJ19355.1 hypothetical protein JN12_01768 [Geobacter argillaceus]
MLGTWKDQHHLYRLPQPDRWRIDRRAYYRRHPEQLRAGIRFAAGIIFLSLTYLLAFCSAFR